METLTEPRALVESARYSQDRQAALAALDLATIDEPIVDIVSSFAALPHCFTQQSCYGHFLCAPEQTSRSLEPVPRRHAGSVRYRIAYLAVCIENSPRGRALLESLRGLTADEPDYVQLGSADWFWERCPNSYALQVQPARYRASDEAILACAEALHVQQTRDRFFVALRELGAREGAR